MRLYQHTSVHICINTFLLQAPTCDRHIYYQTQARKVEFKLKRTYLSVDYKQVFPYLDWKITKATHTVNSPRIKSYFNQLDGARGGWNMSNHSPGLQWIVSQFLKILIQYGGPGSGAPDGWPNWPGTAYVAAQQPEQPRAISCLVFLYPYYYYNYYQKAGGI